MGKRISFLFRPVRAVVRSRVFRYGALVLAVLAFVGFGYFLWHKWYTRIPGLAGEIYSLDNDASYYSALSRLAALPEEERMAVLDVLLQSPGAKYHELSPGREVMMAIVGLDHDGSFSQRLVDRVIIPALKERPLPHLIRDFHPSAMRKIAAVAAKEIVGADDPDEYFERALGLIFLARHMEAEDLSAIGTRVVEAYAKGAIPHEYEYAFSCTLEFISLYIDERNAAVWGDLLLTSLEHYPEPSSVSAKLFALYRIAEPLNESTVDVWAGRAWKILEAQRGAQDFSEVASSCVWLAHYASDAMKSRLSGILLERMVRTDERLGHLFLERHYPPMSSESITEVGNILLERALSGDGNDWILEKLGTRASEAAISSWTSRLLQEIRAAKEENRKDQIRRSLRSLLKEVPNEEYEYSVVVTLDEIQHGEAAHWEHYQWRTFAREFEYIAPRLTMDARNELRQLLIEKLSIEVDNASLPAMAEALALLSANMPALDMLPLAQRLLDRAVAYPAVDFEDSLDILDALSFLAARLPPMQIEELGDALLTFELLESVLCERPPSLFEMTAPRPQAPVPTRREDPGVARSARILGRLACNISGSRSSVWGTRVLEYLARNEQKGRPGVHYFLAELAPCASEADAQLWGQVIQDAIPSSKLTRESSRYKEILTLAAHAPDLDVCPVIEKLLLTGSFSEVLDSSRTLELLSLPQIPADYGDALWNRIPRTAPGDVDNQEQYVKDYVEFWINTRPPVSSESERARQAQQCIDFLADPLVATWASNEVIEYLGHLTGSDFSWPPWYAGWHEVHKMKIHRSPPGDFWKALEWAASTEGETLGLKVHRNARFSNIWSTATPPAGSAQVPPSN